MQKIYLASSDCQFGAQGLVCSSGISLHESRDIAPTSHRFTTDFGCVAAAPRPLLLIVGPLADYGS